MDSGFRLVPRQLPEQPPEVRHADDPLSSSGQSASIGQTLSQSPSRSRGSATASFSFLLLDAASASDEVGDGAPPSSPSMIFRPPPPLEGDPGSSEGGAAAEGRTEPMMCGIPNDVATLTRMAIAMIDRQDG